ncbi:MAG TPA: acetyl-CoA carboxylase biotin carboxyl carrier protein [Thermoanaerobaculaceae bacterium]|nr:acetyl-CoA carboxylase biotin carboxyl carrier protein [Thermoanaerobaculaceae bacterium]HRS17124.1 acetyl-CoA carboxylase biotin carboxyl carrier protein [Thermoanaerobaculaceae bacterium]
MLTLEELCQLIRVVAEHKVGSVEIEQEGMRIRIDGPPPVAPPLPAWPPAPPVHPPATHPLPVGSAAPAPPAAVEPEESGLVYVTSPIVGTFYRAPNPQAPPFVEVGAVVRKGQVLCIVEAMKLMNEIESDVSGTVVKVFPDNAQPVEFGQRLFAIRPA